MMGTSPVYLSFRQNQDFMRIQDFHAYSRFHWDGFQLERTTSFAVIRIASVSLDRTSSQSGEKGFFHCANCDAKLFSSTAKFDSGTGWPSFTESLPGAFKTKIDYSFGMKRVEYHCANCGVHHGHVFDDGPGSTQKRFCNNGLCLLFKPES